MSFLVTFLYCVSKSYADLLQLSRGLFTERSKRCLFSEFVAFVTSVSSKERFVSYADFGAPYAILSL